jgi:acetyl esterase/lipase
VTPEQTSAELPDAVLRYADHDDGLVDVHLPPGHRSGAEPPPLVFFVHGGFWRQAWDRRPARPFADALADAGHVVAVPEYRRVGGAGGWPATADDVAAALTATPRLLSEIGVRTSTLTLVGHSAGGQLVLWLATRPDLAAGLRRVVALAPVADLRFAARERLGSGAVLELLGGTPEEVPDAYAEADPATRLRGRPPCEVVVVHGDGDDTVPAESSRGLAARFDWLDYRELAGAGHDLVDPAAAVWPDVLAAIR